MPLTPTRVLLHPPKRYALSFDGENDYVRVVGLSVGTEYTACIWFRMTDISDHYIIDWRDSSDHHIIMNLSKPRNEKYFQLLAQDLDGNWYGVTLDLGDAWNEFHFACLRISPTRIMMRIDDAETEATFSETTFGGTGNLYLFRHYWGGDATAYTKGITAQLLLYNRFLSDSEIQHNYLNPMNPVTDGLVLWLKMEEGSGTTVHDYSRYGNDGTIYGASWIEITHDPVRTLSPLRILSPVR